VAYTAAVARRDCNRAIYAWTCFVYGNFHAVECLVRHLQRLAFFPSFFYIGLLAPVLFRLRQSAWVAAFLDSANVCAVALMTGVTLRLAADGLRAWSSWLIAAVALLVLLRWKVNSAWIVLGGGSWVFSSPPCVEMLIC
jgi:hypothetical protein